MVRMPLMLLVAGEENDRDVIPALAAAPCGSCTIM